MNVLFPAFCSGAWAMIAMFSISREHYAAATLSVLFSVAGVAAAAVDVARNR